jgi:phosphoserine aminotransferase
MTAAPLSKPKNPCFSSGPCAKHPGWSLESLQGACLGRSHRSAAGKAKLVEVIEKSKKILGIPADYRVGIVPASDTGAVEMALWSLLGARPVTVLAWEAFSADWATDVAKQLKLPGATIMESPVYGVIPDLSQVDFSNDVVFPWNGTTSGVRVPDANWIPADRQGLTICDATSATFAMQMDWSKLDVTTWSWQKVMGGEAQHGMIVLSPRAVERLETYKPAWPLPKLFRMTSGGKLSEGIFKGETINTPSMLAVEDALDGLNWAERIGGLPALIARSEANLAVLSKWVEKSNWAAFLVQDKKLRSSTSITLTIIDPWFVALPDDAKAEVAKKLAGTLEKQGVAYDIGSYRTAPPGLRIWGGSTVEASDLEALTPWLDWAYAEVKQAQAKAV